MNKEQIEQLIKDVMRRELSSGMFTSRKVTDTPNDALEVVNRRFVTRNGITSNRPTNPVTGQFYFDITLGYPVWYNGTNWVNSSGSTV